MTNLITRIIVALSIIALATFAITDLPQATTMARLSQGYLLIALTMAGGTFIVNKRWQILGLGFTGILVPVMLVI